MIKILQKIFAIIAGTSLLLSPYAAFAQEENPPLPEACELDVVLVMDRSGSINATELQDMKDAFNAFVSALMPFGTEMSLVSFASSASLDEDWTSTESNMNDAINAVSTGGNTNWAAAIDLAHGQFPHRTPNSDFPDLMVFASDGAPNAGGGLAQAIIEADEAKAAGIRIETLGIGVNAQGLENLEDISSSDAVHDVADFDQFQQELEDFAMQLCDQVTEKPPHHVVVVNDNEAVVVNEVHAGANTGLNYAGGSSGGDGGDGGDIYNGGCGGRCDSDDDVKDSTTGDGGEGGDGSAGGYVETGDARANASAVNVVNTNITRVSGCDCEEEQGGEVISSQSLNGGENGNGAELTLVHNRNRAVVANGAGAGANSGLNAAAGSEGGSGGEGGEIDNEGDDVDESDTGDGGDGGNGGLGGAVVTGEASSHAGALNIINTNLTRVRR